MDVTPKTRNVDKQKKHFFSYDQENLELAIEAVKAGQAKTSCQNFWGSKKHIKIFRKCPIERKMGPAMVLTVQRRKH